jgi:hypothetical protein
MLRGVPESVQDVTDIVVFCGMTWFDIEACSLLTVPVGEAKPIAAIVKVAMKKIPNNINTAEVAIFSTETFFSTGVLSGNVLSRLTATWPLSVPKSLEVVVEPARIRYLKQGHNLRVDEGLLLREQLQDAPPRRVAQDLVQGAPVYFVQTILFFVGVLISSFLIRMVIARLS